MKETFGMRIRRLRLGLGLNQETLAAEIGVSRPYISGLERGHDRPGLETARAMATFFRVSLDSLLGDEMPRPGAIDPVIRRRAKAIRRAAWGDDLLEAAGALSIDAGLILSYENGTVPVESSYIERLSVAAGTPAAWIMTGDYSLLTQVQSARVGARDPGLVPGLAPEADERAAAAPERKKPPKRRGSASA